MVSVKKVQARFYVSATGSNPVRDWLMALPAEDRQVIGKDIQRVELGWPIGMPYCRSLGKGLWEIRSNVSDGRIARVLICFVGNEIGLLHAFIKKTQKTPVHDMELALRRMKELQ